MTAQGAHVRASQEEAIAVGNTEPSVSIPRPRDGASLLPPDAELPLLPLLFDREWYTGVFRRLHDRHDIRGGQIAPRRLTYRPGQRALVSYVASERIEDWIVEHEFAAEVIAGEDAPRTFRYPDDPYLPGLARATSAVDGDDLLREHVGLHSYRLRVRPVRYRPSTRAVLRYTARVRRGKERKVELYARAMRPKQMKRFIDAGLLADRSRFILPSLAGAWEDGGVVWLTAMPGDTVRQHILRGDAPAPDFILDHLESLWALGAPASAHTSSLPHSLRFSRRFLGQVLRGSDTLQLLGEVLLPLLALEADWRPSGVAHNDFYDDQLVLLPDQRIGLVDFEECGPGDQMLDVANMLAHLRWSARFLGSASSAAYHERLRTAALDRFSWRDRDLALRESFALVRLSTNPVRSLAPDWPEVTAEALALAKTALDAGAPSVRAAA
jgi:hypothetical protein